MIVKCIQQRPTEAEIEVLGEVYKQTGLKHDSHLTVGRSYLVFGIVMNTSYPNMGKGTWVSLLCDHGHLEEYPIALFEIIDGRVDPEWIVKNRSDGLVLVQPELLYGEYFSEHYTDRVPEAVKSFRELMKRMEQRSGLPVSHS